MEWWQSWWSWIGIAVFAIWVFTIRGFSGRGQPSNPPFGGIWTKLGAYLRKKFGPWE